MFNESGLEINKEEHVFLRKKPCILGLDKISCSLFISEDCIKARALAGRNRLISRKAKEELSVKEILYENLGNRSCRRRG